MSWERAGGGGGWGGVSYSLVIGSQSYSEHVTFTCFEGDSLHCALSFLWGLRRSVNIQCVQPFTCCKFGSDDFQGFYMSDQKPEVPSLLVAFL